MADAENTPEIETPSTPEPDAPAPTADTDEPTISAFDRDDDAILDEALGEDTNNDWNEPDADAPKGDAKPEAEKPAEPTHTDADARGIEILIAERGFTAAQAARLAEKDPEMVRELGAAAIEAAGAEPKEGATEGKDAPDAVKAEPEGKADDADAEVEDVTEKLSEVLGRSFDKGEAAAIAEAIKLAIPRQQPQGKTPDVAALVEKQVNERVSKAMAGYDAALSDLMARNEAQRLAEVHPEIKTPEGYAKVYAKAQALSKTREFKSIGDLMEAAAVVAFGPARSAEARAYKEKVARHREDGVPTAPGQRAPAGITMDRDDLILEMKLNGKTDREVEEELARASRR